jgi:hypothetical protein
MAESVILPPGGPEMGREEVLNAAGIDVIHSDSEKRNSSLLLPALRV